MYKYIHKDENSIFIVHTASKEAIFIGGVGGGVGDGVGGVGVGVGFGFGVLVGGGVLVVLVV